MSLPIIIYILGSFLLGVIAGYILKYAQIKNEEEENLNKEL
jgi:uncharacterized integral membrane protein